MVNLGIIQETVVTIVLAFYYIIEGMVKAVLPARYLYRKDISRDTVLVTGAGMLLHILLRLFQCQVLYISNKLQCKRF